VTGTTIFNAMLLGIFKQFVYKTRDKIYIDLWNRFKDRSWTSDDLSTQQTSIQAYVKLYGGGQFMIHTHFSTALVNVGMAFLYGTAMPMFFPVMAGHFFMMYVYDRISLCWIHMVPPAYSAELIYKGLRIIRFMPVICLPWVYWQLGNR